MFAWHYDQTFMKMIADKFNGRDDKRDITVVLNKPHMEELMELVDRDRYDNVIIQDEGEYFYISSSIQLSELFVENVRTAEGILSHSTDLLLLPHYVPHEIINACKEECEEIVNLSENIWN